MSHISAASLASSASAMNLPIQQAPRWALSQDDMRGICTKKPLIQQNGMTGITNSGGNDCWVVSLVQMIATVPSLEREIVKLHELFRMTGETHKARTTCDLLDVIHRVKAERTGRAPLSVVDSYAVRCMLREIVGMSPVTGDYLISLEKSQQVDSGEVCGAIMARVSETYQYLQGHCPEHLAPGFQSTWNQVKVCEQVGDLKDGRFREGAYFPAEELYQFASANPDHPNSLRICSDRAFSGDMTAEGLLTIQSSAFKPALLALKNKNEEIHSSHLPPEVKRELIKQNDGLVFQQVLLSVFRNIEEDGPMYDVIDEATHKIANLQLVEQMMSFKQAPQELMISLNKREFNPQLGQGYVKVCHMVERVGDYGSYMAPVEATVPMFEKFTIPAELASEDSTYEVSSFIIHQGGERGGGGHYTSYQKIEGNWFYCNDDITRVVTKQELEVAIQTASFLFYSKMPQVDPDAFRLSVPESRQAFIEQKDQLIERLSAPIPLIPKGGVSSGSGVKKAAAEKEGSNGLKEINVKSLRAELAVLCQARETIQKIKREDRLQAYILTLPDSIRSMLFHAVADGVRASEEIASLLLKNHAEKGRELLDRDLRSLVAVYHKNDGFGDLVFSKGQKGAAERGILDQLVAQLMAEPYVDMKAVHELFYNASFQLVRNQIREKVYLSSVSDHVERLSSEQFSQKISGVLDSIIEEKQIQLRSFQAAEISKQPSVAKPAVDSDLKGGAKEIKDRPQANFSEILESKDQSVQDKVHTQLCKELLRSRPVYKEGLKDPVKAGRSLLDRDLCKMKLLLTAESSLLRFFDRPFELNIKESERADFDTLMAMLHSDENNTALHGQLDRLFYRSSISSETRNKIREIVFLKEMADLAELESTGVLFDPEALKGPEIKKTLIRAINPATKK